MFGKILLGAMLATAPAFAQRGGGGGEDAGAAGMPISRPQTVSKAVQFANRLNLDNSQREKTQVILNDALKEIVQLRTQKEQARAQIADLIIRNGSQDDIKKLVETYSGAAAQVTALEMKAFANVCALLKPGQKAKAASAFDLLAATLDPPGSAGRGAMGAGNRGRR